MRVLIVSPRFAPANAADSHRVRLLLPYFSSLGCEVEVLAVDARDTNCPIDPWLNIQPSANIRVHLVRAWPLGGWGLNGLAQRSFVRLYRRGAQLLRQQKFDLVFFSTTEFLLHLLGPLWKQRFGVPFCMDYQDPWVNDYYQRNPAVVPPGGRLKYGLISRLHSVAEKQVASRCSGFLAVSSPYLTELDRRYGLSVVAQPRLIQPFPAEPKELETLPREGTDRRINKPNSKVIRYIGRGGADMASAAIQFFEAWRELIEAGEINRDALRFEAIGTSYAVNGTGQQTLAPLASDAGLAELVSEVPDRLGYREMLLSLVQSDALVVFGSNDPAYTASKIYPYLLAKRPLLAIFHQQSSVVALMAEVGGGHCVTFNAGPPSERSKQGIKDFLLGVAGNLVAVPLSMENFDKYSARSQAKDVAQWLSLAAAFKSPAKINPLVQG